MAKAMARIQNGVVTNIERHSNSVNETETLVLVKNIPVRIGDSYLDGKFYRDGELVLPEIEAMRKELSEYNSALSEIESAISVSVKAIGTIDDIVNARKQAILSRVNEMLATLAQR